MNTKITSQSAAKPQIFEEGSETIPQGSTLVLSGSAIPQTDDAVGDDIVQNKNGIAFVKKAKVKFNNKFDYSLVLYVNAKTKVCIICPEHGPFWQTPDKHLHSKCGCPICLNKSRAINTKLKLLKKPQMTKERFIEIANEKYNGKYLYIITNWQGVVKTSIKVICPTHGEFITNARSHILKNNKCGCPKCGNLLKTSTKTLSYNYVLSRLKKLYNNFYTYEENPNYINQKSKIKIYCPIHGEFVKSVQKHLAGQGCPDCKIEELIKQGFLPGGYCEQIFQDNPELVNKKAFLYYFKVNSGKYYKIGITTVTPESRIKGLKAKGKSVGLDLSFEIVAINETTLYKAFLLEQLILSDFSEHRIYRKWSTELLDIDIFDLIKNNFTTIF